MACCTFFGHRNTPEEAKPLLKKVLIQLIEEKNVCIFYIGNNGAFDRMATSVLNDLKSCYPHIQHTTVLAYLPGKKSAIELDTPINTIYPDGLETVPRKYAILKRNHWMLDRSDYVITYVTQPFGGAAQFKQLAEKRKKVVINLCDNEQQQNPFRAVQ